MRRQWTIAISVSTLVACGGAARPPAPIGSRGAPAVAAAPGPDRDGDRGDGDDGDGAGEGEGFAELIDGPVIESLTEALAHPRAVVHLKIEDQGLTELPPEIGLMVNLRSLDADGNQLTAVPPELGQLRRL